jgi:mannose-6-phosphate isomerase-like protein (cupin superfamily)
MMNEPCVHKVELLKWEGLGFRPLVESGDWLVALMNWESRFDLTGIGDVERHNETDEVFVLVHGRSLLYIAGDEGIQAFDMQPNLVYNVTKGTWHSVIGTKDTTWLIVESRGTTSVNTNHRQLTEAELAVLTGQYPDWLRSTAG